MTEKNTTPEIQIAGNSKKQPDFSLVIPAFENVLTALSTYSSPPSPWELAESRRVITQLSHAEDNLAIVIISSFEKEINKGNLSDASEMLTTFVRPERSFLNSESPCPKAFMQRDNLLIDGVNANLDEHTKDPNFWWQPVTNPIAYELVSTVEILRTHCSSGHGVDFCSIKNKI